MIVFGQLPISKELRYIRIYLVVLVIVLLFFNGERVIKISTNHDSIDNVSTSNDVIHLYVSFLIFADSLLSLHYLSTS